MKVFVSGSAGYLGSHVKRKLSEYCIVQDFDIKYGQDIRDKDALRDALDGCQYAVHLAAVANMNYYSDDEGTSHDINVHGTRNLIEICREKRIPIFFASTCCAYGQNGLSVQDEMSPICPADPYAQSKVISENDLLGETGIKHIIMRLATFYGGPNVRRALAIPLMIDKAYHDQTFEVHGTGTQTRTYTHVYDVAEGIVTLVKNYANLVHQIYNISTEVPISVLDMAREISRGLHQPVKLKWVEDRNCQFDQGVIHNRRLTNLGWRPMYTFETGVKELIDSYRVNDCQWFA